MSNTLFDNALQSIQAGIEDYGRNDLGRAQSAVRNFYAGVLLLAKEVLVRAAPKAQPGDILGDRYKPVPNKSGGVDFVSVSPKTIDFQGIGQRFRDFGLQISNAELKDLSRIRNDIEHRHTDLPAEAIREAIAKAFPVVVDLFRLAGEEPARVLGETWQTMLEVRQLNERELSACRASFSKVVWESPTLAKAPFSCPTCESALVAQKDLTNTDAQSVECVCRGCGEEIDAETAVTHALATLLESESYSSFSDGEAQPIGTCPECNVEAYLTTEDEYGCAWCGCKLGKCGRCSVGLSPENVSADDSNFCGYCDNLIHKD